MNVETYYIFPLAAIHSVIDYIYLQFGVFGLIYFLSPRIKFLSCMNFVLWLEVLLRELLLFIVKLPNNVKATMIQRFVFPQHIHLLKEWDYA